MKRNPGPAAMPASDFLNALHEPSFNSLYLEEPRLLFGGLSQACDAKTGLAVYGPFDRDNAGRKDVMRLGVVGTPLMQDAARHWIEACRGPIRAIRKKRSRRTREIQSVGMDPIASPYFPGLAEVFRTEFILPDELFQSITQRDVAQIQGIGFFEPRVTKLVAIIMDRLRVLAEGMTVPDLVIVALPTELRQLCTVASRHKRRPKAQASLADQLRRTLRAEQAAGQLSLIDVAALHNVSVDEPEEVDEHSTLHHALKARAMELGLPIQLAWQTTFEGGPTVQDDATRAWNFWTAAYYKSGGTPWRVAGLEPGTCYVGLSYYRDRQDASLRTCMAQAFSAQGDGIVLRSEPFNWSPSSGSKSPHLPREIALDLMERVLSSYAMFHGQKPGRVVVHKWQRYEEPELEGFLGAIDPSARSYDMVALGDRDIRFFRIGSEPPIRGTLVNLSENNALLYTNGFVPFLGEYPGMRVPRPIEITEHHGTSSMTTIAQEILALTKMDWNTASFAGREPITTAFSWDVGQILAELPPGGMVRPQYRFYM